MWVHIPVSVFLSQEVRDTRKKIVCVKRVRNELREQRTAVLSHSALHFKAWGWKSWAQ